MSPGLAAKGVQALDETLAGHVERGDLPGLTGILLTQRMATSPEPAGLVRDFWAAAYAAVGARPPPGGAILPPGGQPD
jgi:hypothetical protein